MFNAVGKKKEEKKNVAPHLCCVVLFPSLLSPGDGKHSGSETPAIHNPQCELQAPKHTQHIVNDSANAAYACSKLIVRFLES